MDDYKQGMSKRIKMRRRELNYTQEEISEILGISVKHFSETERGLTGLSVENLIKLSSALGVSIDYLIKGDEEEQKSLVVPLNNISHEKEALIKQLIDVGIKLAK